MKKQGYRNRRRGDHRMTRLILIEAIILCVIAVCSVVLVLVNHNRKAKPADASPAATESAADGTENESDAEETKTADANAPATASDAPVQNVDPNTPDNYEVAPPFERTLKSTGDSTLDEANRQAAMYDYDTAISMLEGAADYSSNQTYQDAVASYKEQQSKCVVWSDNTQITHIFFHTLVVDADTAFSSPKKDDYNDVMTTVDEFVDIIQDMYDEGYVLVSLYDIAKMEPQADGTEKMTYQNIVLPEGKKPFVMSQDDVSYYEYMTGHGFASRFVIDEATGKVINEMDLADGTVLRGSYDLVPILEDFLEAHPDFCYKGARGTIALTGYDGIFGYRTSDFWYNDNCDYYISNEKNNAEKANNHTTPNLNIEQDKQTASAIATRLKEMGWTFASHSWGHRDMGTVSMEAFTWDTDIWEKEVEPLIGDTDIIIFPKGADIGSWRGYEADNERYLYLKSVGFDYFCNVDSSVYWVQRTDDYFRMGRRDLDGRRFWQAVLTPDKNLIGDLVPDVSAMIDPKRCPWTE